MVDERIQLSCSGTYTRGINRKPGQTTNLLINLDRHLKPLAPIQEPITKSQQDDTAEYRACIIHIIRADGQNRRKRHPSDNKQQVAQGKYVDGNTPSAHPERAIGRLGPAELAQEEKGNGKNVRSVHAQGLERDDGVEGRDAANVDERQQHHHQAHEQEGVGRDAQPRVDVTEEARERQAVVPRKGPDEPRHGGEAVEGGAVADHGHEGDQEIGGRLGARGVVQHVDERQRRGRQVVVGGPHEEEQDEHKGGEHDGVGGAGHNDASGHVGADVLDLVACRKRVSRCCKKKKDEVMGNGMYSCV